MHACKLAFEGSKLSQLNGVLSLFSYTLLMLFSTIHVSIAWLKISSNKVKKTASCTKKTSLVSSMKIICDLMFPCSLWLKQYEPGNPAFRWSGEVSYPLSSEVG